MGVAVWKQNILIDSTLRSSTRGLPQSSHPRLGPGRTKYRAAHGHCEHVSALLVGWERAEALGFPTPKRFAGPQAHLPNTHHIRTCGAISLALKQECATSTCASNANASAGSSNSSRTRELVAHGRTAPRPNAPTSVNQSRREDEVHAATTPICEHSNFFATDGRAQAAIDGEEGDRRFLLTPPPCRSRPAAPTRITPPP